MLSKPSVITIHYSDVDVRIYKVYSTGRVMVQEIESGKKSPFKRSDRYSKDNYLAACEALPYTKEIR